MTELTPPVPVAFLERMQRLLGDEYPALAAAYEAPPVAGLRVNTLKLSAGQFAALAPFPLVPLDWPRAAFRLTGEEQAGKHPYHAAGLYYLQDPSAMVPAQLLDPQSGDRVLDLAAAPGGKATHLASLLGNQGLLVANEVHPKRVWDLAENLERWGTRNAVVTNETPERLADRFEGYFDRVLLDAPCSGEGMFRKSAAARQEWAPELVPGCALRQSAILEQAARFVCPGGRLVYSTCTFAPAEDEGVVAGFLLDHPEYTVADVERRDGFAPGRPDWLPGAQGLPELQRAVRLWPHRWPGEGHFIAVLQRDEGSEARFRSWRPARLSASLLQAYKAFCADNLAGMPAAENLAVVGTYLYALPEGLPSLEGLRFIHPGWWLGSFPKGRFEPAHALALALAPDEVRRSLVLPANSPEVQSFLRGEAFRSAGEDGWTLVTVDGFPLGWGKCVGGLLKSHYPRGLRRP